MYYSIRIIKSQISTKSFEKLLYIPRDANYFSLDEYSNIQIVAK